MILESTPRVSKRGDLGPAKEVLALGKWEGRAVASGFYTQSLTAQLDKATTELNEALAKDDPAAARKALETLEAWPEQAALKYGLEMIRFRGHAAIDQGRAANVTHRAMSVMEVSKDLSAKIKDSVCGLVPEVGAAACAFLEAPLRVLWNFIGRRAVLSYANQLVHGGWEKVVQAAGAKLLGEAKAADPGPLGVLVAGFTRERVLAVAEKNLPDTIQKVQTFNDELEALVTKWEKSK